MKKERIHKLLSLLLAMSLMLSMLPTAAWAAEVQDETTETVQEAESIVVTETADVDASDKTEEEISVEEVAETEAGTPVEEAAEDEEEAPVEEATEAEEEDEAPVEEAVEENGISVTSEDSDVVASGTCDDNLTWTVTSDCTLTISGTGALTGYEKPWVFYDIKTIIIENGVTSIGDEAFTNTDVESIFIGSGVTSIGRGVFSWTDLTYIEVSDENPAYSSIDGVLFNKEQTTLVMYPYARSGAYMIPDGVICIGGYAFLRCGELTDVTIPDSVTTIERGAFSCGENLTSITIPASVTNMEPYSVGWFLDTEYPYPTENFIIYGYRNTAAESYAEDETYELTFVALDDTTEAGGTCGNDLTWVLDENGVLTISGTGDMDNWSNDSDAPWNSYRGFILSVTIENGVTSIGDDAFWGCTSLTSITIPDSVTSIGDDAFYHLTSLTDVYYVGSEDEWAAISFGSGNTDLTNATIHYNYNDTTTDNPFTDVSESAYYYAPVLWAYENGITSGSDATHFAPSEVCTRGQVVTFLWRAQGCPEPESTTNPFTDVYSSDYYYKAVLWAYENGVTSGTDSTHFSPAETVTRAQVVTFIWRAAGEPTATSTTNPFSDVYSGNYYYNAILWAYESGVTSGTNDTHFGTTDTCTRGQVVTFLYRAFGA